MINSILGSHYKTPYNRCEDTVFVTYFLWKPLTYREITWYFSSHFKNVWRVECYCYIWWYHGPEYSKTIAKLECGIWYHHPRCLQCVLSWNLRIFKVVTWHYRYRHNLKNNCIWDNLQYCLLVPRSPSKPVMLTYDLQSRKVLFIEIGVFFGMYNLERQLWYWHLLTRHCPCNLLPESTSPKHEYREKLWGHPVTSSMTSSP